MKLNKEQKEAVFYTDGPLLIVAGPGTGKTQLLSQRAAHIMKEKNVPGENILILTYTNAAAKSVKERLARTIGFEGYKISAETFHSFANSVIIDSEEASAYMRERIPMTSLEKVKCFEYILDHFTDSIKALRPFGAPYFYVRDIERKISGLKNEGITPDDFEADLNQTVADGIYLTEKHLPRLRELAFVYRKYEELKSGGNDLVFDERGRYDFDDMVILAAKVLIHSPELTKSYYEKYKYILVDEFQDTNGAQLKLLFLLCNEKKPNLCCVGDDDQSIYRFQGASIANFRTLREKFPEIKVIKLKNNYRSTKEIIKLSGKIIEQIPAAERLAGIKTLVPKKEYKDRHIEFVEFSSEDEEILYIVNKVKEAAKQKRPYSQIACLVRKRKHISKLIEAFLENGIPYATDGKEDISGHKRVRQIIDGLNLARASVRDTEEKDIALYRTLSTDFLSIPAADILKFIQCANLRKRKSGSTLFEEFIRSFPIKNLSTRPKPASTKMHYASWVVHRLLQDADSRPIHDIIMGFIEDSNLFNFVMARHGKDRIAITRELRTLSAFVNMVKDLTLSRPGLKLGEFLEELETMKTHGIPIEGKLVTATQDGVRIITAHASKGLEFHTCFIPFCIQGKSWPLKPYPERIPLPPGILKIKQGLGSKVELARLSFFDEARLFYVASSRAKSNLIFTSSPSENGITSSFVETINLPRRTSAGGEIETLKNFLKRDRRDHVVENTKGILQDMVKNLALTPTKLNKYLRCKRQFLYDSLLLLPGKKNASLVSGNCAHKALEDTYDLYKKKNVFPDFSFFKSSFLRELRFQGVSKAIENSCNVKLTGLREWFEKVAKDPIIPINLEKKKLITLKNGIIFTGKYDKVEFEDETKRLIRVIDYKTGKPDKHLRSIDNERRLASEECDDYVRQLVAYKMLYERDTHERALYKVSHGVLVFLEPVKASSPKYNLKKGDFANKKVAVTDEMVDELEQLIYTAWKKINRLDFDKLPGRDRQKCGMCTFDSLCWEAT